VGRFRINGRAGTNRVRFRGRIRGRALRPGTYVIRAQTLPAHKALAETTLVIFKRRPLPEELAAAQASNTCRSPDGDARLGDAAGPLGGDDGKIQVHPSAEGSRPIRVAKRKTALGVLGARFSSTADAVKAVPAFLFFPLGVAIGLLAAAAMPVRLIPNARMAAVLAYRRTSVALAGSVALAAVAVVYALV